MLSWAGKSSALWFLGSHCFDTLRWLFEDEAETVYCVSRSRVLKERGVDTPDFFHTIVQFGNGAVGMIDNQWILPDTEPFIVDFKLNLLGSEGGVRADCTHNRTVEKYTGAEATYPTTLIHTDIHGKPGGFAIESIRHFADCIIEGREPMVGLEDGLAVTRFLLAAERSAETGQPVRL